VEDDVEVVSGTDSEVEVEDEVVPVVVSCRLVEIPALWAATAVNSRAWMKNERLERRITNVCICVCKVTKEFDVKSRSKRKISRKVKKESKRESEPWVCCLSRTLGDASPN
jgi:hypothetical protein